MKYFKPTSFIIQGLYLNLDMRIGFDAKRAFFNRSGLGNYSRFIIQSLINNYQGNEYVLYSPKAQNRINFLGPDSNHKLVTPRKIIHQKFPSYWRSMAMAGEFSQDNIQIFHGLSGEIPKNITRFNVKSVVTIHDLIFLRFPDLYKSIDRKVYTKKFRFACENADKIIAISQQTKEDIIQFFNIDSNKIEVIYQSCNQRFHTTSPNDEKKEVKDLYKLPDNYLLYVGTIEKRKNLLSIVKALHQGKIDTPLVVVGKKTPYFEEVNNYIKEFNLRNIRFLKNVPDHHLPALYQMASVFIYPSVFEGFGIPILEALFSKLPVITSKGSCFPEAGGPSSIYIDPENYQELAESIKNALENNELRSKMIKDGLDHAQNFRHELIAKQLNNLYQELIYQ